MLGFGGGVVYREHLKFRAVMPKISELVNVTAVSCILLIGEFSR